jgi:DNA-binding transcriptional LysR family regulator
MDAVLRFVQAGLGAAVVPSMVVAGRREFRATPFVPPGLTRTVALAHRRDVEPPRAAREFERTLFAMLSTPKALPAGVQVLAGATGG